MDTNPQTDAQRDALLLEAAIGEFKRDGRVSTARCDVCQELIEMKNINDQARAVSCHCGKFNSSFRGI